MKTISRSAAVKMIKEASGFFTVTFMKRVNTINPPSEFEYRTMNCRQGVRKHLKGGEKSYDADTLGLITTYSIDAKGYRSIPIEGIMEVVMNGEIYKVDSPGRAAENPPAFRDLTDIEKAELAAATASAAGNYHAS